MHPALHSGAALVLAAISAAPALAAPRDEWAMITHAGNLPYVYQDFDLTIELGRVDHEYQIRKTEVTAGEWFEFVQAYKPYVPWNDRNSSLFISGDVSYFYYPDNSVGYFLDPAAENLPVDVSWRYAARYCNWLHNNKATNREAFEQGVYDTSTFGQDSQGFVTDSTARSADARCWLPSEDEWVKATFFDPNKNGPDQPGYWQYPNRSDVPLIEGPPGVGQTGAGWHSRSDVASYYDQTSPWGLWDTSGGQQEWLDSGTSSGHPARGSRTSPSNYSIFYDSIETPTRYALLPGFSGFRVARQVPGPSTLFIAIPFACLMKRKR